MNIPCICGHLNKYHAMYETPNELLARVIRVRANNCKIVRNASKRVIGYTFYDGSFFSRSQALMTAMWNIQNRVECVLDDCMCKGFKRDNLKYLERLSR
jgi:hypothetical protein